MVYICLASSHHFWGICPQCCAAVWLQGIAREPLAESHVSIQCQARVPYNHRLSVPNYHKRCVVYRVHTDMDCCMGDAELQVDGKRSKPHGGKLNRAGAQSQRSFVASGLGSRHAGMLVSMAGLPGERCF